MKTKYGGVLLSKVGMDPNDCIYPIAHCIVDVEDNNNCSWFLSTLKQDLGIQTTSAWTIMSDKKKWPNKCCRSWLLYRGDVLKTQVWKIARCTTVDQYEEYMEEMRFLDSEAHAWLADKRPNTWVREFKTDFPKCGILLNNNCEVFNK